MANDVKNSVRMTNGDRIVGIRVRVKTAESATTMENACVPMDGEESIA